MPSFLDVDTTGAKQPTAVAGDKEYKIRIIGYVEKELDGEVVQIWPNRSGDPCMMPIFEIPSVPHAKEFNTYIPMPKKDMSEKELAKAIWRVAEFKQCFGLKDKADLTKTIGNEGWAIVGLKEDAEYGEQNFIKKFILPK